LEQALSGRDSTFKMTTAGMRTEAADRRGEQFVAEPYLV